MMIFKNLKNSFVSAGAFRVFVGAAVPLLLVKQRRQTRNRVAVLDMIVSICNTCNIYEVTGADGKPVG
jgi:hypothetical protein